MIEVFRTNINRKADAEKILRRMQQELPGCRCNFDLEDCDRIFRVESPADVAEAVMAVFATYRFRCEVLP